MTQYAIVLGLIMTSVLFGTYWLVNEISLYVGTKTDSDTVPRFLENWGAIICAFAATFAGWLFMVTNVP